MRLLTTRLVLLAAAAALAVAAVGAAPAAASPLGTSLSIPAVAPAADPGLGAPARLAPEEALARCAAERVAWRTDRSLEHLRALGLCEVDRRLATLDRLDSVVADADVLTDAHRAALARILSATRTGLTSLRAEIAADATLAELKPDVRAIFGDYRVYALVARQVWLVRGADVGEAAVARLTDGAARLREAIDAAAAAGRDVTAAEADLARMIAAAGRADGALDGVAASVLPLMPAAWNAGEAEPVLRAARSDLAGARSAIGDALRAARQVMADLRG